MRLAVLLLLAPACGPDDGRDRDAAADASVDASPQDAASADSGTDGGADRRPFALAASGAQLVREPRLAIVLGPADLATDVDVPLIHQEFYGLPWDSFEAGEEPPAEWARVMDDLADQAAAVGPVSLALQLVSGPGRRFLADRAVVVGGVIATQQAWSAECYDFGTAADAAAKRAAYLAYVDWMVRRFQPRWVNVAIEMNLFSSCGEGPWRALVEVEADAYRAAKAAAPDAIVFASFQIDWLYGLVPATCPSGDRDTCFEQAMDGIAGVLRDRFAVSTFPYLFDELREPSSLPDDWLTRPGDRGHERTIVAETGWLATPLVVARADECRTGIESDEDRQLAWFERVIAAAESHQMELVTWVSDRDVFPTDGMADCPCSFDADWCADLEAARRSVGDDLDAQASFQYALQMFGSMGLRTWDGTERPALGARWRALRARPW